METDKRAQPKYPRQSVVELVAAALRFAALVVVGVVWAVPFWLAVPFSLVRAALVRVLPPRQGRAADFEKSSVIIETTRV